MTLTVSIIITVLAIIFSGLFSGSEIAFMQTNRVKMQIDAVKGGAINKIIYHFNRKADMFLSTLLVGNNIIIVIYGIAISAIINPIFNTWFNNEALVLVCNTVLSTFIILIAGEFIPKTVFRINPHFMLRVLSIPLYLIYLVFYPVSLFISWLSKCLMVIFGIDKKSESLGYLTIDQIDDYLQHNIDPGDTKGEVENEVKIFRNAIDFKDTQIRECMIPRNEIIAVPVEGTTKEDLLKTFMATGLSKIVVYQEDIDDVLGYIHVAELFNPSEVWQNGIKPVIFTPESMLAQKMMRRMLSEKKSVTIVVDEFGGTAGLVTVEDLVEEIFGEIEDEHDLNRSLIKKVNDGVYEVSGRAEIENINEELGLKLPESDDYHTLAGFILENLEALPSEGDVFESDGLRFEILRMSSTRIELVKIYSSDSETVVS